jgi:hypothetical protein
MSDNHSIGNGFDKTIYGSNEAFIELLHYLKQNEGHKGKLKTYYKHAFTEQQAAQLGNWLCGGTGEFWYVEKELNE